MNTKALAAIAFLAMALITVSFGALAEEVEEPQVEDVKEIEAEKNVTFMFVQTAQSGTLVPVDGVENRYILTLMSVAPQTIAFSDRPERIVVQAPMQKFLDGFGFSAENPPNAALEILDADEEENLAVVMLFDPIYDNATYTLQYNVSILEQPDLSYAAFNERADLALPETFGSAALFIDDCADSFVSCAKGPYSWSERCGHIDTGCCWSWSCFCCEACHSYNHYVDQCVRKYGSKCDYYFDCCH